jgi:hypothetical protein
MIDSHLPRFAQGVQAVVLAIAFLVDARWVVPLLGLILLGAWAGGAQFNVFAYLYQWLPVPRGESEPAAPPRFSQLLGTIFLGIGTIGLFAMESESAPWWVVGWGPALAVAVLAALAATTSF